MTKLPVQFKRLPRGEATPNFFQKYETADEASLRLTHSFIHVDNIPCYVMACGNVTDADTGKRGQGIQGMLPDGNQYSLVFESHVFDFRAPEPGYIMHNETLLSMTRIPARKYQQGLTDANSIFFDDPFRQHISGFKPGRDVRGFLSMLSKRKPVTFSREIFRRDQAQGRIGIFLSPKLAIDLFSQNGASLFYRNTSVGHISEHGGVFLSPSANTPWVQAELNLCGIKVLPHA